MVTLPLRHIRALFTISLQMMVTVCIALFEAIGELHIQVDTLSEGVHLGSFDANFHYRWVSMGVNRNIFE